MQPQQFITALSPWPLPASASPLACTLDFANARYQGHTDANMKPQGPGCIMDDEFNYIVSSDWHHNNLNGHTFIRLVNETSVWGEWKGNATRGVTGVKMGGCRVFLPEGFSKGGRVRRGLAVSEGRARIYVVVLARYAETSELKRQYNVKIEKVYNTREKSVFEVSSLIDLHVPPHQENVGKYLEYLQCKVKCIKMSPIDDGLFITSNIRPLPQNQSSLGIYLDCKKLTTKSVGYYKLLYNELDNPNTPSQANLNGIGLSKTLQEQGLIGYFKDNMLIRQLNAEPTTVSRNGYKQVAKTIKQALNLEHIRSLNYYHDYMYFDELKCILTAAVEIHKYIEMFERMAYQQDNQSDESMNHPTQKYQHVGNEGHNDEGLKGSLIDQLSEVKLLSLKKEIYKKQTPPKQLRPSHLQQVQIVKRPGFILDKSKSPRSSPNNEARRNTHRSPKFERIRKI